MMRLFETRTVANNGPAEPWTDEERRAIKSRIASKVIQKAAECWLCRPWRDNIEFQFADLSAKRPTQNENEGRAADSSYPLLFDSRPEQ